MINREINRSYRVGSNIKPKALPVPCIENTIHIIFNVILHDIM